MANEYLGSALDSSPEVRIADPSEQSVVHWSSAVVQKIKKIEESTAAAINPGENEEVMAIIRNWVGFLSDRYKKRTDIASIAWIPLQAAEERNYSGLTATLAIEFADRGDLEAIDILIRHGSNIMTKKHQSYVMSAIADKLEQEGNASCAREYRESADKLNKE